MVAAMLDCNVFAAVYHAAVAVTLVIVCMHNSLPKHVLRALHISLALVISAHIILLCTSGVLSVAEPDWLAPSTRVLLGTGTLTRPVPSQLQLFQTFCAFLTLELLLWRIRNEDIMNEHNNNSSNANRIDDEVDRDPTISETQEPHSWRRLLSGLLAALRASATSLLSIISLVMIQFYWPSLAGIPLLASLQDVTPV